MYGDDHVVRTVLLSFLEVPRVNWNLLSSLYLIWTMSGREEQYMFKLAHSDSKYTFIINHETNCFFEMKGTRTWPPQCFPELIYNYHGGSTVQFFWRMWERPASRKLEASKCPDQLVRGSSRFYVSKIHPKLGYTSII